MMCPLLNDRRSRPELVLAHPGHELRLTKWISEARPNVSIIAKGSRSGTSCARIAASRALLGHLGAGTTSLFGVAHDVELYKAIIEGDAAFFDRLQAQLRNRFVESRTSLVATDAWQNYNPVHDLTHLLTRVACAEATAITGRTVECLDYPVVLGDLSCAPIGARRLHHELSPAEVMRKQALLSGYPDIADDAAQLVAVAGEEALRSESLHDPLPMARLVPAVRRPLYEEFGEARVASGVYSRVLRWRDVAEIAKPFLRRLARAEEQARAEALP